MLKDPYNWKHRVKMELDRLNGDFVKRDGVHVSKKDRDLILEFIDECRAEGLSNARVVSYLRLLRLSKRFLKKDFADVTKQDMKKAIANLEGSDFKEWTKQGYRITFKKFFRWYAIEKLGQKLKRKEYPEIVDWYETTMKKEKKRLPEGILNEDDVKILLEHCLNIRDKAIVSLLWDSGCRVGEVLNLQLKHLEFDKYGCQIIVYGKTGSRRVRLIPSVPYLANWKENHPTNNDPNSFLFVGLGTRNFGKRIGYSTLDTMLRKLTARAKLKKKTNAHSFRHARATFFASRVKEAVMKETFGWTQQSQMTAVYTHLSGREVDKEIRMAQGIVDEDEKKDVSKLKPIECFRCSTENPVTAKYCQKCSFVLDSEEAIKLEKRQELKNNIVMASIKKGTALDKNLVKEVLKEMIKAGEIEL